MGHNLRYEGRWAAQELGETGWIILYFLSAHFLWVRHETQIHLCSLLWPPKLSKQTLFWARRVLCGRRLSKQNKWPSTPRCWHSVFLCVTGYFTAKIILFCLWVRPHSSYMQWTPAISNILSFFLCVFEFCFFVLSISSPELLGHCPGLGDKFLATWFYFLNRGSLETRSKDNISGILWDRVCHG